MHIFSGTLSSYHLVISVLSFILRYHLHIVNVKILIVQLDAFLHMHIPLQQPLTSRHRKFPSPQKVPLCSFPVNNCCQLPKVINDCPDFYHHRLVFMFLNFKLMVLYNMCSFCIWLLLLNMMLLSFIHAMYLSIICTFFFIAV